MNTTRVVLFAAFACTAAFTSAANIAPASSAPQSSASASGASFAPQFSAGGEHLVFISHANNLVTNDDLALNLDVFIRDLTASNTVLVSVNTSGMGGGNADAHSPSVSSNGQFVAFVSRASNLVSGDTNNSDDIFVRDIAAGTTRLVSVALNGASPANPNPALNAELSGNPMISADGRWVIFESRATNLIATPAPLGSRNIYARDTWSNVTVLVTSRTNGSPVADVQTLSSISSDGRFAAFASTNGILAANATNAADIFVRDVQAGTTLCVSTNLPGIAPPYGCSQPKLAANGDAVFFFATNGGTRVVKVSLVDGQVTFSSPFNPWPYSDAALAGTGNLEVSATGDRVVYETSTGLKVWTGQSGGGQTIVSCPTCNCAQGASAPPRTFRPSLSRDGRTLTSLEECSGNVYSMIFDLVAGSNTDCIPNLLGSAKVDFAFIFPTINADGRYIAFDSSDARFVSADFNAANDVFVQHMLPRVTELISVAHNARPASVGAALARINSLSLSSNGTRFVYTRLDEPSAYRDTNSWPDVYLSDFVAGTTFALSVDTNITVTSGGQGTFTNIPPNTNGFTSPIISADGKTVVLLRWNVLNSSPASLGSGTRLFVNRASNDVFSIRAREIAPLYGYDNGSPRVDDISASPSLSADGTLLAFHSRSSPLTEEYDYNNRSDVFVRYFDRTNVFPELSGPTNFLISRATNGFQTGNGYSTNPVISPDGRWVAFITTASNIVTTPAPPTNIFYWGSTPRWGRTYFGFGAAQAVVSDLGTNRHHTNFLTLITNSLCSYTLDTNYLDGGPDAKPTINLKPLTNDVVSVFFNTASTFAFFRDRSGTIHRHDLLGTHVSWYHRADSNEVGTIWGSIEERGGANLVACTQCSNATVSANGNLIAFERPRGGASNVVDVYVRDLANGLETMVAVNPSGAAGNGTSSSPLISADGRYVIFQSKASDLVANDTNGFSDIFVRDRLVGITMLVSANAQGRGGNGPSTSPVLAPDGRTVAFQSFASDLAPGDYNDKRDVFVVKLGSVDSDGDGLDDDWELTYFGNLARDGSGDFDNDTVSDHDEFIAATDPTASGSFFRTIAITPLGGTSTRLVWNGNPARPYRVEFKDDLNSSTWTTLDASISWNGNTATATDLNSTNRNRFYRAVRLP